MPQPPVSPEVRRLSPEPAVDPAATVRDCSLGAWTEVAARTQLVECELGDYSYVMNDCDLMYCAVGKFCSIASHVRLNPSNHPMWRPAQHHFTYRSAQFGFAPEDDAAIFAWRRADAVRLGHDVWIGHGAIVLPGVSIGTGAVVGAGAVVTRDVPAYSVVVGTPARVLRPRFAPGVAEAMQRIAWWDWSREEIIRALADFRGAAADFAARYDR
jgi:phosphonate metabolism protein (transferase hexapeptide repeat family)